MSPPPTTNKPAEDLSSKERKSLKDVEKTLLKDFDGMFNFGRPYTSSISTGCLGLDVALGVGGIPRGRITTIEGDQFSGKTTLALRIIANVLKQGGTAVFIDTEYALDEVWAKKQGVDVTSENFRWLTVGDLENAGEICVEIARSGAADIIVFDSVAGAPILAVVEGELGDSNMGKRGKIMSDFIPKLNGPVSKNNVCMIFINQLRESLNIYSPKPLSPGGRALPYHSSLIITLKGKKEKAAQGKEPTYVEIHYEIEKNKLAVPFRKGSFKMDFNGYVDPYYELVELLTNQDFSEKLDVKRGGAYYTLGQAVWGEELRFQGKQSVLEWLADHDVFINVEKKLRELLLTR